MALEEVFAYLLFPVVKDVIVLLFGSVRQGLVLDRNNLDAIDTYVGQTRKMIHRADHVQNFIQTPNKRIKFAKDIILTENVHACTE